ncbi:LysM peptidoglycan-binding domain-containing M23 family metallopeptidase [Salipiger abyssi]|uniref:Metalloendopeptidase-like membrane protein n=1 Tax=Salipiger abyssi TaxID=1250539 RepID=A0A1P8UYU8_9RHOB|nr:LysM peptidoglycan-binding domain-containing M23 family metallopeptidase [Salipiger abyssi]APZ54536.1 metalloendopeptidase-like membrane protein [Salipiger abyssi]
MDSRSLPLRFGAPLAFAAALGACSGPFDYDMRGRMGGQVDTSQAALAAVTERPQPDDRGIISYPNYQVAVARRGDTATDLANRIGLPAGELARYNGIQPDDRLRDGEIIALPRRVSEPSPATGAAATGPIRPAEVDITTLAGNAIESAPATPAQTQQQPEVRMQSGVEPIRHKVARGETAFTIARLYNVTPRSLAEWNALDSDYSLREGQYLLIPVVEKPAASPSDSAVTPPPGTGSQTPQPPSASQPLPQDEPSVAESAAAAATATEEPVADIGQSQSAQSSSSSAKMSMPVNGSIIREYAKGKNEGIDISASAGTTVKAAASGTVAAITTNTDNVQILVIRHPDEVLSIYTHVDQLSVQKGDAVSRGQSIGKVRAGDPSFLHFEVRKGFDSVDPMTYLR